MTIARTKLFGIQLAFYYGLLVTLALWYVQRFTPLGRNLYFTGANREVARLSGVQVDRLRAGSLIASSLIAALAAIILAGVLGSADPNAGSGYLLPPFAAAFLGATAITPGRFNPWGAVHCRLLPGHRHRGSANTRIFRLDRAGLLWRRTGPGGGALTNCR